jgi:hypothetical protein
LTYFDVSGNDLTGALPNSIGQWTDLNYFNVFSNVALTGTLPASIGNWTALYYFKSGVGVYGDFMLSSSKLQVCLDHCHPALDIG